MKLGELKIASLMLTVPSLEISLDGDDGQKIEEKIMELKANPNLTDYLYGLVFSINRAFSIIEKQGLAKRKSVTVPFEALEKFSHGYRLSLDKISDDVFKIERISQREICRFEYDEKNVLILTSVKKEPLEIVYRQKIKRINEATSDLYEIELAPSLLEIIPYFIKSELVLSEDPDEARLNREHFFELLKTFSVPDHVHYETYVDTVYRMW